VGWFRSFLSRSRRDEQLEVELRFHLDSLVREKLAAGLEPAEARRQAALEFGGCEQVKEELRDVHRIFAVDTTVANLRSAVRLIARSPSLAVTVVVTFALGIGANSAVFSAIDAVLLRPLAFPEADRLVSITQYGRTAKSPNELVAPVRVADWSRRNSAFAALSGYNMDDVTDASGPLPEKRTMVFVTARFLQVLGVAPALGRDFTAEEQRFGGPRAVLMSDRLWKTRFGADPAAIGRTLHLGKTAYTVAGVMPPSFRFPSPDADLWAPAGDDAPFAQGRQLTWYTVVARLKRGITLEQARADISAVQAQLGREYPKPDGELGVRVEPLKEQTVGGVRRSLWLLFGSVSLLLLIACTNIAALLVGRAADRREEIAVRYALGASRASVVAQLLTETLVLGLAGSAVGLAVAWLLSRGLRSYARGLPRIDEISLDWRIVLYTVLCGLAAAVVGGVLPALWASRTAAAVPTPLGTRTQVSARNPLQWFLAGVQAAVAVTLLTGAGLLVRSLHELGRVSPGFDASHVLTFRVTGSWGETVDMATVASRIDRTLEGLRSVPGIEAAATSSWLPGLPGAEQTELTLAGQADAGREVLAVVRFVAAGYFATMRIPLLTGDPCRDSVASPSPGASWAGQSLSAVVNRSFADTYLSGTPALGRTVRMQVAGMALPATEIRAVVGDAREAGLDKAPLPTVYWCISAPGPSPRYLVRTGPDPAAMIETVRRKVHELEPARSVFDAAPLDTLLYESVGERRMRAVLLSAFAVTALALACVGLYGTLSYFVSVRRREVGLRVALGSSAGEIASLFLLRGLAVSLAGCFAGLLLAAAATRVLSGMLYGVAPLDPATFGGSAALLLVVAVLASLAPALRAARLQPMHVLREE
jgi:putative ABC transport system permease protein